MRTLYAWLVPGGFLLAAAAAVATWAPAAVVDEIARGYPWVACAAAFLLGALFHRSRVAVAGVIVALAAWSLGDGWPPAVVGAGAALSIGIIAPMADRGVAAAGAWAQWGAAALLGALVTMIAGGGAPEIAALFSATADGALTPWATLPAAQITLYGVALALVAVALLFGRGPVERGLFWCLVLTALAFVPTLQRDTAHLLFLAAGLTLALSVVETSYAMAYRDELTGLPGRRALLRDAEALGGTYAVAMVDVDHFKKFNDKHGHDVGDQVLRMVASRLGRGGGMRAYRYGGEEFTLLLPGRTRDETLDDLDEVRRSVESARFALRSWVRPLRKKAPPARKKAAAEPRKLSVTVSIGVADSTRAADGWEQVIAKADKALYRAKKAGRNRVAK